jgi:hypothetical protein
MTKGRYEMGAHYLLVALKGLGRDPRFRMEEPTLNVFLDRKPIGFDISASTELMNDLSKASLCILPRAAHRMPLLATLPLRIPPAIDDDRPGLLAASAYVATHYLPPLRDR